MREKERCTIRLVLPSRTLLLDLKMKIYLDRLGVVMEEENVDIKHKIFHLFFSSCLVEVASPRNIDPI